MEGNTPPHIDIENLSCYGLARILVNELGGPKVAKIYEIRFAHPEDTYTTHAYVVPNKFKDEEQALNARVFYPFTCGYLRKKGEDVTNRTFSLNWSQL
ncbi:MAG: hypothetical protein UU93_C0003G0048 [Candidatus Amesbacteria bacterium GW2011_GWA2_42_12]|uniref:Uncharacterized protein n=1 Tax=Candidatus Amesbacteria bacterium GW2011_GWA2_42_12 TaxID=1618356 RepID=A0A0G0Y8L1_9BACT|nr:MAG: hypothetical protein UU93_C0003G0048 [Candidatus Amesbacteria bacterium GW2011_GWA2_42_12]